MQKIDFLVVNSYHGNPLSPNWQTTFANAGASVAVLTPNYYEFKQLRKLGINTLYLADFFPKGKATVEEMQSAFAKFGITDLADFFATEQAYFGETPENILPWAYKYLMAYDQLFQTYKVKNAIQYMGGEVVRRTCTLQCKAHNVFTIYIGESFLPGQTTLYTDEQKTKYVPKKNHALSDEEISLVLENKIKGKKVIKYDVPVHPSYRTGPLQKAVTLSLAGNWNILKAYIYHKRKTGARYQESKAYTAPVAVTDLEKVDPRYFFFPFNVAAESELFIRNPEFINQVDFVLKLADYLPEGYKLAVKPHPGPEGYLTKEQIEAIGKDERIVFFHESVNTYDIVSRSAGVVIASSTVGLESHLLGKPTAVLGFWPYTKMGDYVHGVPQQEVFQHLLAHKNKPGSSLQLLKEINKYTIKGTVFGSESDLKELVNSLVNEFK